MTDSQLNIEPVLPPEDHECIEDNDPLVLGPGPADTRGWGPGWPVNNSSRMVTVRGGDIALSVRAELAPVIEWLVDETVRSGYQLHHGQCWGFANRAIRGTNRASNHSWGLAVDLNAPANPMAPRLVTDMPNWMVELWKSHGFRWGGDYSGRKDAMHYEYMGTPDDARRLAGELGAGPPDTPPPSETRPLLRRGAKGHAVRLLQERLNAHGFAVVVDGDFGPATERAVIAFQEARSLRRDGIVGPRTWAALG